VVGRRDRGGPGLRRADLREGVGAALSLRQIVIIVVIVVLILVLVRYI
jgi:hypothetical protein